MGEIIQFPSGGSESHAPKPELMESKMAETEARLREELFRKAKPERDSADAPGAMAFWVTSGYKVKFDRALKDEKFLEQQGIDRNPANVTLQALDDYDSTHFFLHDEHKKSA